MVTRIVVYKKPKVKNPVFVEGLPGIGNVGRVAAGYLVEELKAEKFAELISDHFLPLALTREDSTLHLLKAEFFYWKAKRKNQRDLILMIGDSQSVDPQGQYEITTEILKFLRKFKVKEIFTLGGLSIGEEVEKPKVIGLTNDPSLVKKYSKYGIIFDTGTRVGSVVGIAGLLIALGKYYGMKGVCLLGETAGLPIIPDHKSAESVLKVLVKILNLKIDLTKLEKKIENMKDFLKKMKEAQARILSQLLIKPTRKVEEERLTYIG